MKGKGRIFFKKEQRNYSYKIVIGNKKERKGL